VCDRESAGQEGAEDGMLAGGRVMESTYDCRDG
jgi:hypothetical protein